MISYNKENDENFCPSCKNKNPSTMRHYSEMGGFQFSCDDCGYIYYAQIVEDVDGLYLLPIREFRFFNYKNKSYSIERHHDIGSSIPTLYDRSFNLSKIDSFDFGDFDIKDYQLLLKNMDRWHKLQAFK